MGKKPGGGRTKRQLSKQRTASESSAPAPSLPTTDSSDEVALINRTLAQRNVVLMCADAGLDPIEAPERATKLADLNLLATLRTLSVLWAKLDIAKTTNWTEKNVQVDFLKSTRAPWSMRLRARIEKGDFFLTPRGFAQLTREVLENANIDDGAEPATQEVLAHLLLSINTEQNRTEFSADGMASAESIERIRDKFVGLDAEQTIAALREYMVHEVASSLFDAPLKLEVLQGNTQDLWFRGWPDKVTREELGATPADAFAKANKIQLLELLGLGYIITERAKAGQIECTREELLAEGASAAAVDYCFKEMSLSVLDYKSKLEADRLRGSVHYQRYTITQYPFLQIGEDSLVLIRYQWGIDRFFGSQLYWPTFSKFPSHKGGKPKPGSVAEAFSDAMNHVFERTVGEVLANMVANSRRMTRLINEEELQGIWTERRGATASACDWVIPAGPRCFVIDATNHHLDHRLAQGLGSVDDYAKDMDETFAEAGEKFEQLAKTVEKLIASGETDFGISAQTVFIPLVVLPDSGVPNLDTTDLDLQLRSLPHFKQFGDRILAPAVLTLLDLQLLEGLAEYLGQDPRFPDVANLLMEWRLRATARPWPTSLREIIEARMPGQPIPRRIFRSKDVLVRDVQAALDAEQRAAAHGQS